MKPELLKAIDPYVRKIGLYTSYELSEKEFVGLVDLTDIDSLYEHGYEEAPTFAGIGLEAAKIHPISETVHDLSLRKIDPENNRKQYHIHIWMYDPAEIWAHHELRPDIRPVGGESLREMYQRLRTHYRPTYGENYIKGKADESVRELVE